jgi:uncharacterized glyoxalase superfamily protein PhnB
MPEDAVVPVLVYADVPAAIAWLCGAFGFHERWRAGDHRAQLGIGASAAIAIAAGAPDLVGSDHVMVRVGNVDAHCEQAQAFGAEVSSPPSDHLYGERQYTARDLTGRSWVFSQSIADMAPEDWGGRSASRSAL